MTGPTAPSARNQQPWLHRLQVAVRGNATCVSTPSGDIRGRPGTPSAEGLFVDDRRVLDRLTLTVDGTEPELVSCDSEGPDSAALLVARNVGDQGPDPAVHISRVLRLVEGGLDASTTLRSRAGETVACRVRLELGGDGAELHEVKRGHCPPAGLAVDLDRDGRGAWRDGRHATTVEVPGARLAVESDLLVAEWDLVLHPGGEASLTARVRVSRTRATPFDAEFDGHRVDWSAVRVTGHDARLGRTVRRSLVDLRHLLLADPDDAQDVFAAAGTPWYLTLFGRDSIWAARMCLPFGTELARGTLRALARRQGTRVDPARAEEPGKILHEVRRETFVDPGHLRLPPLYYGTVDATPLWVVLLHDAWRWGLPEDEIRALDAPLRRALEWMRRSVSDTDDGFLRYLDESGTGLSNQGWKDSGDSMRTATGSIADGPIALVETQAYAVEAALGAAELLEGVFGEDSGQWREWAGELASRVRRQFWVAPPAGPRYLAMALDGRGRQVDGVGSNMGHALGTGMLTAAEEELVARRLGAPDLLGPLGISTLSRDNPAFNPLGYHTGSVWTHDTAIAAWGLSRAGQTAAATTVVRALVDVATSTGYRWPELYSADPVLDTPTPYPASCRPQAWAAASVGFLLGAALRFRPDAPAGRVEVDPLPEAPFGAFRLEGLRLGARTFAVDVDAEGAEVQWSDHPS